MSESERFVPEEARETVPQEGVERIEGNIWRPGILDQYQDQVGAAATTKALRRTDEVALRILGDTKRFERPMRERLRAGRMLAELRNELSPDVDLHNIVKTQLAHGGEVAKVDEEYVQDLVKGNLDKKQIAKTDGMITNLKDYPLYVSAADCYPVGVYDPDNQAIGLFHNGVYGLANKISENGIQAMMKQYGSDPEKLVVTIGPGISQDGYPLPADRFEQLKEKMGEDLSKFTKTGPDGEILFDLQSAIAHRLTALGIRPENIEASKFHTDTDNDKFSSERIEGNKDRDSFGFMMVLK